MTVRLRTAVFLLVFAPVVSAIGAPRDAVAVLNRCGKPMRGDDTVLDDSVAGGHRVLKYERGFLYFDKVAMDGWTFRYGTHGKPDHLDADAMARYMPCLKAALVDSASDQPIQPISGVSRAAASLKEEYKQLILWVLGGLVLLGIVLFAMSRRRPVEEEDV